MTDILTEFKAALSADAGVSADPVETLPNRLAAAAAAVLPVDGVGISLLDDDTFRVPLGASSSYAEAAERLQFTLGEGPCLYAAATQTMTRYTERGLAQRWPLFHGELIQRTPYRAITSIPLHKTTALPAAIDVYLTDPHATNQPDYDAIGIIATAIADTLTGHPNLDPVAYSLSWLNAPATAARTNLWVAIGMLNVHLAVDNSDALAHLRGYAWARSSTVDDIARQLITGELPLQTFEP